MAQLRPLTKLLSNGIHALVGGTSTSGTALVCMAGWPQTKEAYTEILPLLARSHRVLVLDLPGLGDSAPSEHGYSTNAISSTLASAVASELGGPDVKYHLIGHDVGAWIASAWTRQFPSSLLSVTLMDSIVPGIFPPLSFPPSDDVNRRLFQFSFNRLPDLPEILVQGKEREMIDWLFDMKSAYPQRITAAKREHYAAAYARPGGMANGFAYYRAFDESVKQYEEVSKATAGSGGVSVPVLAIGGEKATGKIMERVLAISGEKERSKLVIIPDCGHYVMEEQPDVTAREILQFVDAIDEGKL
ncbi:hypothetical protein RBB50_011649 [Rhinocladiella similis]